MIALTSQAFIGLCTSSTSKVANAPAIVIVIALAFAHAAQIVVTGGKHTVFAATRGKHTVFAAALVQIVATAAAATFLQVVAAVAPETAAASASAEWWIAAGSRSQAFRRTGGCVCLEAIVGQQQGGRNWSKTSAWMLLLELHWNLSLLCIVGFRIVLGQQWIWFMCYHWRPARVCAGLCIRRSLVARNKLSRVTCSQQLSRVSCPKPVLGNTGFTPIIVGTKAFKGSNRVHGELFRGNEGIRR